ncbi:hypothetical protein Ptr86124_006872 [Pyrenophora tritici-repentis]|uniref:Uncharacterized protein n=1 Tax=Pyrenophora tritici-repentis TaxID=45151 RepID=A0A922T0G0_9PLEO|nr:hypothetical protein Ptr86124_006872 [Pyrenophora tritici-repentis]
MKFLIAALYGMVALAGTLPAHDPEEFRFSYRNDGLNVYECNKNDLMVCTKPQVCAIIEKCEKSCIFNSDGADCIRKGEINYDFLAYYYEHPELDMNIHIDPNENWESKKPASPEKRQSSGQTNQLISSGINKDDTVTEKTYECSNDHTGVLVCQYGFCSTDHYCKKGIRCSDNCSCCRRGLEEVEGSDTTQILPRSTELAPRGGCTPGKYTCNINPFTNSAWILTCNPKGEWQYSSDCGTDKCIESPEGVAHCVAKTN